MRIYTRQGDDGTTGLFHGSRVWKDDLRIEAYGTVDELGAALGLARAAGLPEDIERLVEQLQHWLFDLGATLGGADARTGVQPLGEAEVERLEAWIDQYSAELPPLRTFILSGGSPAAARLHWARTVCRRGERLVVELAACETLRGEIIRYVNRLSDALFVAARTANQLAGVADVVWKSPG